LNLSGRGAIYLPVPVLPLVGGLGGLAFTILFGSFSTRRAGTVFAMISLGVAELMAASSLIFDRFFGGEEGITTNRSKAPLLLGLEFTRDRQVYYLIAFWLFVSAIAMYAFSRTPVGRMANAVRDNPERAEFVGYSQNRVRFVSFCAAGFFAGIAGGLFAVNYEILTAANMGLHASGAVLLMTYTGGIGILEMIHFVVAADTTRPTRRLFWVAVAPRTLTPWLGFAALVVAGALGARWAAPRAAAAFTEASRPAATS